jgi:hypothetical protein
MSCCGSRRATFRPAPVSATRGGSSSYRPSAPTEFEYTGHSQLSVTGPMTGVVYRFQAHGQRVQVHGADAASLRSIPALKALL